MAAWIGVFGIATFLVALQEELTPLSSATAVATTLNDVGPGLGQVGATESFEIVNPLGRFVLTVCMLLGRLEIFTVLALLSPAFWKLRISASQHGASRLVSISAPPAAASSCRARGTATSSRGFYVHGKATGQLAEVLTNEGEA